MHRLSILPVLLLAGSCMKLNQAPPAGAQLPTPAVFSSDQQAAAAMAGLYTEMMTHPRWLFNGAISLYPALGGDELHFFATPADLREQAFAADTLSGGNTLCPSLYGAGFEYVNAVNAILRGLSASTALSETVKSRLRGEAEFSRALSYFYLVNLFGKVPLVTGVDYIKNESLPQSPTDSIYAQIIADLLDAQALLPEQYTGSLTNPADRIYPNKAAATALLARVYLYRQDWADAATQASAVIADSSLYGLEGNLKNVFLAASREAIWQLQPVNKYLGLNTGEGNIFLPPFVFSRPAYGLDSGLLNAFEPGDRRLAAWVGSRVLGGVPYTYPFKYKASLGSPPYTEYNMVLRLAEQYLIRAEARAQRGELAGAAADIDTIRARAGLGPVAATDKDSLLAAVYRERRIELFAEWGHRWLDLRRTGQIDDVMKLVHPGWDSHDALYPIPSSEIQLNPRLDQNPGY